METNTGTLKGPLLVLMLLGCVSLCRCGGCGEDNGEEDGTEDAVEIEGDGLEDIDIQQEDVIEEDIPIDGEDIFVSWESASQSVFEDEGTVSVTAVLSDAGGDDVTVPFTVSGTATNPGDHDLADGSVTITAGSLTGELTFTVVDDSALEGDKTVVLTMGTPVNAALGATVVHTVTIIDDEVPSITVTAPNGGEVWRVMETHDITWTSENVTGAVDILYSIDNGGSWIDIVAGEPDDGAYSWTIPNTPGTTCLVRVQESDGSPFDTSDAVFEIQIAGEVWYADLDAITGANNGTTWADAFLEIQDAVTAASGGDEIWVADGTYHRQGTSDVLLTMQDYVAVYGGFNGTGTSRADRDPSANITILDGQDMVDHVVAGASQTVLDGLIIIGGQADGSAPHDSGGGMYNDSVTALLVENCAFSNNRADDMGGGMCNNDSTVTIDNCDFNGNIAGGGGGMHNENSSPMITDCIFRNNSYSGGVMAAGGLTTEGAASSPVLSRCIFDNNAGYNGGAIRARLGSLTLDNCVFFNNYSDVTGSGILNSDCDVKIANCTFTSNSRGALLAGWSSGGGSYTIANSILWDNPGLEIVGAAPATVRFSNIDQAGGYSDGGGNFSADPNFIDAAGGDLRIGQASPCIDAGDGDSAPATDVAGQPRSDDLLMPNSGTGTPDYSDIGAYEFIDQTTLLLTDPNGGEAWTIGSSRDVTWVSSGTTNVKIELSRNGGITWEEIEAGTSAAGGSYTWSSVTGPSGPHCIVRISDAADASTWDVSDNEFSILSDDTWYVDASAAGANNGTSWTDAFNEIQDAAAAAAFGDDIWAAAGAYHRQGADTVLLTMGEGIDIYGGFPMGGGAWADRDPAANVTALDGRDLVEHVVAGADNATLDGFTVTGGNAAAGWPAVGGGMVIENCSPVVSNCIFTGNHADDRGGAIYIADGTPVINGCSFNDNTAHDGGCICATRHSNPVITSSTFTQCAANDFGGALRVTGSGHPFPSPTISDCMFIMNIAGWGGGVSLTNVASTAAISGCLFERNVADSAWGGGLYLSNTSIAVTNSRFESNTASDSSSGRGGAVSQSGSSDSTFISCVFSGNVTMGDNYGGGALCNEDSTSATLINCTFDRNQATRPSAAGGAMYNTDGTLTVTNCILWGDLAATNPEIHQEGGTGTVTVRYSDIEGAMAGAGNINIDPQFIGLGDLHLQGISPCIDAADGDAAPLTDINGDGRIDVGTVLNTGTGTPDYADMGVYEYQP